MIPGIMNLDFCKVVTRKVFAPIFPNTQSHGYYLIFWQNETIYHDAQYFLFTQIAILKLHGKLAGLLPARTTKPGT